MWDPHTATLSPPSPKLRLLGGGTWCSLPNNCYILIMCAPNNDNMHIASVTAMCTTRLTGSSQPGSAGCMPDATPVAAKYMRMSSPTHPLYQNLTSNVAIIGRPIQCMHYDYNYSKTRNRSSAQSVQEKAFALLLTSLPSLGKHSHRSWSQNCCSMLEQLDLQKRVTDISIKDVKGIRSKIDHPVVMKT